MKPQKIMIHNDLEEEMQNESLVPEVQLKMDLLAKRRFKEISRLVEEAKERFIGGEYQSAESSLAAIPSLHISLAETCEQILEMNLQNTGEEELEDMSNEKESYRPGNYL